MRASLGWLLTPEGQLTPAAGDADGNLAVASPDFGTTVGGVRRGLAPLLYDIWGAIYHEGSLSVMEQLANVHDDLSTTLHADLATTLHGDNAALTAKLGTVGVTPGLLVDQSLKQSVADRLADMRDTLDLINTDTTSIASACGWLQTIESDLSAILSILTDVYDATNHYLRTHAS